MEEGFQSTVLCLCLPGSCFKSGPDASHTHVDKKLQTSRQFTREMILWVVKSLHFSVQMQRNSEGCLYFLQPLECCWINHLYAFP